MRWDSQAACGQPQAPPAAPWLLQPAPATHHCSLVVMVQGAKAQPVPWFRWGAVGAWAEQGHSVTVVPNGPPSLRVGLFLLIPEWPTSPCGPQPAPDVHLTACHMGGCRQGAFRGGGARGPFWCQLLRSACSTLPGHCEAWVHALGGLPRGQFQYGMASNGSALWTRSPGVLRIASAQPRRNGCGALWSPCGLLGGPVCSGPGTRLPQCLDGHQTWTC